MLKTIGDFVFKLFITAMVSMAVISLYQLIRVWNSDLISRVEATTVCIDDYNYLLLEKDNGAIAVTTLLDPTGAPIACEDEAEPSDSSKSDQGEEHGYSPARFKVGSAKDRPSKRVSAR